MCGIVVALTPDSPTRLDTIASMARTMRHRGPDDEGHALFDGSTLRLYGGTDTPADVPLAARVADEPQRAAMLAMGHRRLAIVDRSAHGHQPMRRGDAVVVYNGEIYNHVELRAELEALGERFESGSDTEVLLAAWQRWGAAALERFNGMWSFVLLDLRRRTLLISRDRFGVKPLYVWRGAGGAWLFASEIKALLAHPLIAARPSIERCRAFLAHGPQAWREETEFEGITRFPAGCWAEIAIDDPARGEPRPYWRWPAEPGRADAAPFEAGEAARHAQRYRELLADAVRLRMRCDVRFGTALSGGLDSSSIALLVNDALRERGANERQEVFSSVYLAPGLSDSDESAFIERVAAQLDVRSNRIEPRAADVPAAHERMVWALETPPASTLMSSWHTFALVAARGVTVTLDGQGADEQLAGYARYVRNRLVHAPLGTAIAEARAVGGVMEGFGSHVAIGLGGALARRLLGRAGLAALVRRLGMGSDPSATLGEALAQDFHHNLRNLLHYADATSMAWSVESRMPFMDWRLVSWIAALPDAYKIHAGWTKWLARSAFADRLPAEVAWRRDKMGWPIPEAQWLAGPLAAWADGATRDNAFLRDCAPPRAEGSALARRLRAINLAAWHRIWFEEPGRAGRALGRAQALTRPGAEVAT